MKSFRIEPIGRDLEVLTATTVVSALIDQCRTPIKQVCGGRGICATCHVHIAEGGDALSPVTDREARTLGAITGAGASSRLACQARVMGPGLVIEVPPGIYLESLADAESLIGRRAEEPLLHPVTGEVLVPMGKIITRSVVNTLTAERFDVVGALRRSDAAL